MVVETLVVGTPISIILTSLLSGILSAGLPLLSLSA